MPDPEPNITNVSDTARWVAMYRAWESARPDALFHDPFAARLAGERGKRIAEGMRTDRGTANGWPVITRTRLIDELVHASIADGCDCVLNLAAGLDTRPYRLELPASLTWIEADLPAIIAEKQLALADETPKCKLEREPVDLADPSGRAALFTAVAARFRNVLVITEGLVIYLEPDAVNALGRAIHAQETFRFWVVDVSSPAILKRMQQAMGAQFANARMHFAPAEGIAFFERLGFRARDVRSLFREGVRLKRVPWLLRVFALFPQPDDRAPGDRPWSAIVRFEREQRHS
jgi:methyltransferase (TIGR00027 family)